MPINESGWLSKGYALGQGSRHAATVRQIESIVSKIKSECSHGRQIEETNAKLDSLFEAVTDLAQSLKLAAELSRSNINVAIASNLLEDDIRNLVGKRK